MKIQLKVIDEDNKYVDFRILSNKIEDSVLIRMYKNEH